MTQIDIQNLSFGYDGSDDILFDGLNLTIDTSWKLGLVGRNGRGKTTFFKILRGELKYGGQISGLPKLVSFPFEVNDPYDLGIDVIMANAPYEEEWKIRREMNLLELSLDTLYKPYFILSGGEKTKLQLVSLFLNEDAFPLIDEPTNHLDIKGREVVGHYLSKKNGFIMISHDRSFLDLSTDHTMAIRKSSVEISPVSYSTWANEAHIREKHEKATDEKLKKEISRLKKAEEKAESWSNKAEKRKIGFDPLVVEKSLTRRPTEGAKSAKMMRRAKAMERRFSKKIEEKSGLLQNLEMSEELKIEGEKYHSDLLIKAKDLILFYDGKPITGEINFELRQGDKASIVGRNGSGKTSLLKLISGDYPSNLSYTGELMVASNLKISTVNQDTSFLKGSIRDYCYEINTKESLMKSVLRKMGFGINNLDQDMSLLSEGQKKSILIAGSILRKANIYLWDEPLNYIDITIRETLEDLIYEADISMLFIEHDKTFVNRIANDKVVEIK